MLVVFLFSKKIVFIACDLAPFVQITLVYGYILQPPIQTTHMPKPNWYRSGSPRLIEQKSKQELSTNVQSTKSAEIAPKQIATL